MAHARTKLLGPALAAACLASTAPWTSAGQVVADTTIGITGLAETGPAVVSGTRRQDGITTVMPPVVVDAGHALDAFGASFASADQSIAVSAMPAPGTEPQPIPGAATAFADMATGRMGVGVWTGYLPVVTVSNASVSAFTAGRASAELGETFEVHLPLSVTVPGPVTVTLRMTLDGTMFDAPYQDSTRGLRSVLRLNNVLPDPAGVLQTTEFTGDLSAHVLELTATLNAPECSVAAGYCSYFFGAYASLEAYGRFSLFGSSYSLIAAGDAVDFAHSAQLALLLPEGATATTGVGGNLPAWVSAVPEPPAGALLAAGAAVLLLLRRARKSNGCRAC